MLSSYSRFSSIDVETVAFTSGYSHLVNVKSPPFAVVIFSISSLIGFPLRLIFFLLQMFYAEWPKLFALPPEATVVEILIQCRAIANTIHNAAQAYFFLSVSMRLKVDSWPYLNLILQDSANTKRAVDRGFTRIESYIRSSVNRIQEEIQAENYDQADVEMQNLKQQVESYVKVMVDFTETPYRRIYDALFADYFVTYATDLRYTDAFQNLCWFLVDQGFAINWPENEFSPLMDRIQLVALSETDYPGAMQYSKSNFLSIANVNNAGNDSRYLQMSLNAYHIILHENLLLQIITAYQTLVNMLRNTLPQNSASKAFLLNLREDAILFAQGFQYLRLYVSQSGLLIDWVSVETVEEYMELLIKLDLDVLHRIDILCYPVQSIFQRALDYLYLFNSATQTPAEVTPQEEIPAQATDVTPRELTDFTEPVNTGNTNRNLTPFTNAPPSFWISRRLLNSHGKLPYYIRPSVSFGTPLTTPVIGTEIDDGTVLPATIPQIITSSPGIGTPRQFLNDIFVGKKRPIFQPSPYSPILNTNTGNGIVPEIVAELPTTVDSIPVEQIPTTPTQLYVPSLRFLNERPFGKRERVIPRAYQPLISPPLVTNPTDFIPEGNVVSTTEPILPANNYVNNQNQGGFTTPRSLNEGFFGKREGIPTTTPVNVNPPDILPVENVGTTEPILPANNYISNQNQGGFTSPTNLNEENPPEILPEENVGTTEPILSANNNINNQNQGGFTLPRSLNEGFFGKREGIPVSTPQITTTPPVVTNPGEIYQGTGGNVESTIPGEEYIPTVVSPSPGGLNAGHFGKIDTLPTSLPQPATYTPSGQVPAVENLNGIPGSEWIPGVTNEIPQESVIPAENQYIPALEGQVEQPETYNINEIPGEANVVPTVNEFSPVQEEGFVQPTTSNTVPEGESAVENPNLMPQDEYALPSLANVIPQEEVTVPFRNGNTKPNEEEIAAALDLLSSIYTPLDVNNDGNLDVLVINPEEVGLLAGNGSPQGVNGGTTITLDQNIDGWQRSETTSEGDGYFDGSGVLHDGNIVGTQHGEGEINSNSLGLVDFQSDGTVDMAVENLTNQIVNEDSTYVMLGDLTPNDGIRSNTILRTSLTTQEETSMTTYILGDEE